MKTISAEIIIYIPAKTLTAINGSLDSDTTFLSIRILFEYLSALNTLATLKALKSLNKRSTLNPLLIKATDGRIDSKSIIAIKENGYLKNDDALCFPYL